MILRTRYYVVGNLYHLENCLKNDETWWCVAKDCEPQEVGFIYWKTKGIKLAFEFIAFSSEQAICKSYGMATATIKILEIADLPISFQELQRHRLLSKSTGVRRKFQARWFDLESDAAEALLCLIQNAKVEEESHD
jgi:hypothetical protein